MESRHREFKNPIPTVDIIIELEDKGIILIKRKNPPHGWAIPGGFVDYGESLEDAAKREAKEETSLNVELIKQFHTYSDPALLLYHRYPTIDGSGYQGRRRLHKNRDLLRNHYY